MSVDDEQPADSSDDIALENLTVRAGDKVLLKSVNARLRSGLVTLIVGPSGAGKSMLGRILAGLLKRNEGEISYEGDVRIGRRKAKAGLVGVVFQQFALFDELTSRSNVDFARAHRQRRSGRDTVEDSGQNHGQNTGGENLIEDKKLLNELRVPHQRAHIATKRRSAATVGNRQSAGL